MINIALIIIEMLFCYSSLLILYKLFKIEGIYIYAIIVTVITSIMILKEIDIMGINVSLGFSTITSLIIGGNILTQLKGKEAIRRYLIIILLTVSFSCLCLNLSALLTNGTYNVNINNDYNEIFINNLRQYMALIFSLLISIYFGSRLYYLLKRIKNKILISNILTILIIEFIENIIYVFIAYLFERNIVEIILCVIFRYIIKIVIGTIGTIPIYQITKNIE